MTRVLVCGGRDFDDADKVRLALDVAKPTVVIEGGAKGADRFAAEWAKENLAPENHLQFKADWSSLAKAAGPLRNRRMIEEGKPDLVIAFEGGRGTLNMIRQARANAIPVICIDWSPT